MAAPEDVNVDELRRRARRRLVGAIVLALAVAVFVPMLLESDPKPLGEDVSVKIPPVDEGKFVNRLSEKSKSEPSKAAKTEAKAETKAEPKSEAAPEPAKAPEPAPEPAKTDVAKAEPAKAEPPPAPPPASAPAAEPPPKPAAPSPSAPRESASGEFSVQLAAFSDDKGANALANKLKKAGYPAYTEPLSTSRGTLWRVRVGPYPSREGAVASREKLKGEGYSGIVAAAK